MTVDTITIPRFYFSKSVSVESYGEYFGISAVDSSQLFDDNAPIEKVQEFETGLYTYLWKRLPWEVASSKDRDKSVIFVRKAI